MDAPLRIALIGAGNMGRQHYHRLQRIAGARLCAVADPQGQAFAADAGVPWFGDHRRLLEEARPQAAIVANPNNLHVATALDCLAAGVPLLLEKPVGVQLDEVSELVAVARRSGVPLLVGHHRRHNPLVVRARQLIAEGALGRLLSVTALWQLKKPDSYFEVAWRREPGAGMLLTNLIHDLDLLRHLCGEVREVQALAGNAIRGLPNEDNVALLLRFANGALGSLTGCDAAAAPWSLEPGRRGEPGLSARGRATLLPAGRHRGCPEPAPAPPLALRRGPAGLARPAGGQRGGRGGRRPPATPARALRPGRAGRGSAIDGCHRRRSHPGAGRGGSRGRAQWPGLRAGQFLNR